MRLIRSLSVSVCCACATLGCSRSSPSDSPTNTERAPVGAPTYPPSASSASAEQADPLAARQTDEISTSAGNVQITPIHHATVLFRFGGKAIYLDPTKEGLTAGLPKADFVLLTDIHPDHFDPPALDSLKTPSTVFVGPAVLKDKVPGLLVVANGDTKQLDSFTVQAAAMYNLQRGPSPGKLYHDKGRGNGYVFTFGDKRFYVSGDTECTPVMKALKNIDVAFVCMNLPYTMPPAEAAECIRAFQPNVVYPYHFRGQDPKQLQSLLANDKNIQVRIRSWY